MVPHPDLDAYDIEVDKVRYAEGIDTVTGFAITFGYNIHFLWQLSIGDIDTFDPTTVNMDDVRTLLHENGLAEWLRLWPSMSSKAPLQP